MRCCVPFCRNTTDNVSPSEGKAEVTFYGFPSEAQLYAAWIRALGKQDTQLSDSAVVCSQHFLDDEMYETESGLRQIYSNAIPSTVQVCIICLDTDRKLVLISKHKLEETYEMLTGYPLFDLGNLKQTVCVLCAQRLGNSRRFRAQSLKARSLMMDLVEKHELITKKHITRVKHSTKQLKYNFVLTTLEPDHCDLHIVESDVSKQKTSQETFYSDYDIDIVKNAGNFDSVAIDGHNRELHEDNNANDEFTAGSEQLVTDDSIQINAKLLDENVECPSYVGVEQEAGIQCFIKCEIDHEYDHNDDTSTMHLMNSDGGNDGVTQLFGPQTFESSGSAENKHAMQKLNDGHRNEATVEQSGKIQESSGLHNQPPRSDTKANKEINVSTNCVVKLYDVLASSKQAVPRQEGLPEKQNIDMSSQHISNQPATKDEVSATRTKPNISKGLRSKTECTNNDIMIKLNSSPNNPLNNDKKLFTCDFCYNKFKRKSNLVQHIKTHTVVTEVETFSCKDCQYKTKRKNNFTAHLRTHTGGKPHSCKLCKFRSAGSFELASHMRTHTGEKPYSCELCEYKCISKRYLVCHMRTHSGEKPFSCELCVYKCVSKRYLLAHMKTHSAEKPYSCKLCEYKCISKRYLVDHMRTHSSEKPFSCKLCKFKSNTNSSLVNHTKIHSGEKPHSCNLCKFRSTTNIALVRHMRTHTGEKPFSCKICEFRSASSSYIVRHMRIHNGEKPYSCRLCKYRSVSSYDVVRHMRAHTGEKPYSCELCAYKCITKRYLEAHMREHSAEKLYSCKLCKFSSTNNNDFMRHRRTHIYEKPYSCKLCDYRSSSKSILMVHMKTHNSETLHNCTLCKFKSASNNDLVRHVRTHTGERPYSCELCEYKSAHKSCLVVHMRSHTGEKPFSCTLCDHRCADKSNLAKHVKIHSKQWS